MEIRKISPGDGYDLIFTKSVLVAIRDRVPVLNHLEGILHPGGELLAAENLPLGMLLYSIRDRQVRSYLRGRRGVDRRFLRDFRDIFPAMKWKSYQSMVIALRGKKISLD